MLNSNKVSGKVTYKEFPVHGLILVLQRDEEFSLVFCNNLINWKIN